MNISVHLQFTSLAAAVAFLAAGDKADPTAAIAIEVPGKSESAAPAAAPVAAKKKGAASAPAPSPSPSTGETSPPPADTKSADEPAKKLPAYADTDLPARIMKIVETSKTTGDKSQVDKLKAVLSEFGAKSAKDLTPEQVVDFTPKLAAIEAPAEEDLG